MNIAKLASLVVAVSLVGGPAMAQTPGKTRSEVKAETKAAIRSGDVPAPGESGKTQRELSPGSYEPKKASKKSKRAKPAPTVDEAAAVRP